MREWSQFITEYVQALTNFESDINDYFYIEREQ